MRKKFSTSLYKLKRLSLLLFGLGLFLSSCKKEDSKPAEALKPAYAVKFKVDGIPKVFTNDAACIFNFYEPTEKKYLTTITASERPNSPKWNTFGIILSHTKTILNGETFVNSYIIKDASIENSLWLSFSDENEVFYASIGDTLTKLLGISSDGQVKFTEIKDGSVRGTFSGTFYNDTHTRFKKITDGEFYLAALSL
jgi:hypothetical protein